MTTQPVTTKEALEPCPFCGGKAILGMFNAWCANCEAQIRKDVDAEAVDIINRWNFRVSAPSVAPVVDEKCLLCGHAMVDSSGVCTVEVQACSDESHNHWRKCGCKCRFRDPIPASTVAPQQSVPARCHCNVFCEFEDSPTKPENCVNVTASPIALRDEAERPALAKAAGDEVWLLVRKYHDEFNVIPSASDIAAIIERCLAGGE